MNRAGRWLSAGYLILGLAMLIAAVALAVRTYMPCPYWDEWSFLDAIAKGAGAASWKWLWSQHNEHRLLMTRLLILLDVHAFGGKNITLFVEMFIAQILEWLAVWHVLAHYSSFPPFLKTSLAGMFAFCLFHLNQSQNFTWAFQASFVLAFCFCTFSLLGIAYFEKWRWPWLVAVACGLSPFLAGLNVSGGLLAGPVVIVFAILRKIPTRFTILITAVFSVGAFAYLFNYHVPSSHLTPLEALAHPKDVLVYLLTYFGASWTRLLPHKERFTSLLSFFAFAAFLFIAIARRKQTSTFEWFCIAECLLMIIVAAATALGRLQFGVGQAFASRYQTPAMIYWASLCALLLVTVWRYWPERFYATQAIILLILQVSAIRSVHIWRAEVIRNDALARACYIVMHGNHDPVAARVLFPGTPLAIEPGVEYLKHLWGYSEVRDRKRE